MSTSNVGFAVIYRWRLHAGREDQFRRGWEAITRSFRAERGALGSRLHRADDGTWVAYAQWPDRAAWERSRRQGTPDAAASRLMAAATEEAFAPLLLEPVADHLARG